MKDFFKRHLILIIALILVVISIGLSGYFYYTHNQQIKSLTKEKETLNQKYVKAIEDLKSKDAEIAAKNTEIEDLKKAQNNSIRTDVENDAVVSTREETEENADNGSSSLYDNINGSDDFKNKIKNALEELSSGDSEHYQMVVSQVGSISENDFYGGKQKQRDIYVSADANPAITGSIIVHEAQHVYNVYVDRIWSYNTKEQELPCYEAELVAAQRLGAPAFLIARKPRMQAGVVLIF